MSRYEDEIKKKYQRMMTNLTKARSEAELPDLGPEGIYEGTKKSIEKSLMLDPSKASPEDFQEIMDTKKGRSFFGDRDAFAGFMQDPKASDSPYYEKLKTIKVDPYRKIDVSYDANTDEYTFQASKVDPKAEYPQFASKIDGEEVPHKIKYKSISELRVKSNGYVNYLKSSFDGAKEGSTQRLLMEAQKMGFQPHSKTLSPTSRKMIAKHGKEIAKTPKKEYIKKIQKFLATGKMGKLWKAAPFVGPALMAASGDAEGAAIEATTDLAGAVGAAVNPTKMGHQELPDEEMKKREAYNALVSKRFNPFRETDDPYQPAGVNTIMPETIVNELEQAEIKRQKKHDAEKEKERQEHLNQKRKKKSGPREKRTKFFS